MEENKIINDIDLKNNVLEYYNNNKNIFSPILGDVKLTPQWLRHLDNKDKKHKRTPDETKIRYKSFLFIDEIIKKSHLYQEYKQEIQDVEIKKNGKKIKVSKKVKYFGLIWIIEAYQWHWIRLKVVLKKVWDRKVEFLSVVPARNMKWYHRLYFDEQI